MSMNILLSEIRPIVPELIMAGAATVLLVLELVLKKKAVLGFIGIIAAAGVLLAMAASAGEAFGGMFVGDSYAGRFKIVFLIGLVFTILVSIRYFNRAHVRSGEYYSLLLFATLGMMLMASAADLIIIYLGLELMALSTYVLTGITRHDLRSNEAAAKYFLLGAFSSALLLYGIALIYGLTTTTDLHGVAEHFRKTETTPVHLLAMVLITASFCFKIAAAPFHMWAPDVYEGAPTPVTAFLSVGPKAAGFAVIGRVFFGALQSVQADWTSVLIVLAVLTMAVGNIAALVQTNIKRMLAYSSISHAGYMLLGIIAGTSEGISSVMTYLLIYAFMNMGAFAVVILLAKGETLRDYEGLSKTHPLAAAAMLVFMFSLTGIPPTAGFIGKFGLFLAIAKAGYAWMAVLAVLFSVISAFYYLRIVRNMYMRESSGPSEIYPSLSLGLALGTALLMVVLIGILPSLII